MKHQAQLRIKPADFSDWNLAEARRFITPGLPDTQFPSLVLSINASQESGKDSDSTSL
jgi:hypothetical protein